MALATKCPHCNTTFRVASDQLKLRGGIVRCGACNELFDGNATLVDAPASVAALPGALAAPPFAPRQTRANPPTEKAIATAPAPAPLEAGEEVQARIDAGVEAQEAAAAAIFDVDFDTSHDPFGIFPKPPQAEPQPEALAGLAPAVDTQQPEHEARRVAQADVSPEPDAKTEPVVLYQGDQQDQLDKLKQPKQPEQPEQPKQRREPVLEEGQIEAMPVPEGGNFLPLKRSRPEPEAPVVATPVAPAPLVEPEFVTQGRRRQRSSKTVNILLGMGSVLLVLALLAQGLSIFRNQLAAQMPALKPTLVALCARLGCRVELPAQIGYVSIDQGELQTLSEITYSYATVLHNRSASAQAWPDLELILNDGADKPVLRRVFTPAEYLSPPMTPDQGLAAHSEQAVKLYFELAGIKASGYHIAVFYP